MIDRLRRIFPRTRRFRPGRSLGLLIVAMAAATPMGCSESTYWSAEESPKQPHVEWVRFDHRIIFDAKDGDVSIPERTRLEEFLMRVDPRHGDQILIGTGTQGPEGEIGLERVAAVVERMRDLGLKVGALPGMPQARWDGAVRISVGRYVVTPPDCPDWTKSASYDPRNQPSSNFGCATATNLGLMVADPGDLLRGRSMGPTDGAYAARMIKTWREGEKPSSSSSSMTPTFGGQGGQGGEAVGGGAQ